MPSRDTTLALESRAMSPGVDPVTFSVLLHAIGEASSEMTTVLQHGARSTIISIARDHSASIYTAEAQMLYQNDALPIHTIGGGLNILGAGSTSLFRRSSRSSATTSTTAISS